MIWSDEGWSSCHVRWMDRTLFLQFVFMHFCFYLLSVFPGSLTFLLYWPCSFPYMIPKRRSTVHTGGPVLQILVDILGSNVAIAPMAPVMSCIQHCGLFSLTSNQQDGSRLLRRWC